jgi:hypothetical protein
MSRRYQERIHAAAMVEAAGDSPFLIIDEINRKSSSG